MIEDLAENLVYGRKVLVRALPNSGRSLLLEEVARRYAEVTGEQPIIVRPGDGQTPESVVRAVTREVRKVASAALLIDDWGYMMRSSPSTPWQQRLNSLCVDGPLGNVVGVLLTASSGENLSQTGIPGSPLADAVHEVRGMPIPEAVDMVEQLRKHGVTLPRAEALVESFGGHTRLLEAAQSGDPREEVRRCMFQIAAKVGNEGASRILNLSRKPGLHLAYQPSDEHLVPAVYAPFPGRTAVLPALHQAGLADLLPGSGDSWPASQSRSSDRLSARLMAGDDAYWFDRYMYSALPELLQTLNRVSLTLNGRAMTLRLLSGSPRSPVGSTDATHVVSAFSAFARRGLTVQWHWVDQRDIIPMHDRQLVFRSQTDGYHLPPADRIVGRVSPGNEVDAYLPRAPLGRMESAWSRSKCWACLSPSISH